VQLQGARAPEHAMATLHTGAAGLRDTASLERPNAIAPVSRSIDYAKDLSVDLHP
jgi:alpha-N-arabinofuranosidase